MTRAWQINKLEYNAKIAELFFTCGGVRDIHTLLYRIDVGVRLSISGQFSEGYALIWLPTHINFRTIFPRLCLFGVWTSKIFSFQISPTRHQV